MQWSRFNKFFQSSDGTYLLYNSASNTFAQLCGEASEIIKRVINDPNADYSSYPDLFLKLRFGGFLVDDRRDDDLVRILKMRRLTSSYAGKKLLLTIAPTRECNFDCEYCYEKNKAPSVMSDNTCEKLVDFIKKQKKAEELDVTWYGGEPLLALGTIVKVSKKITALRKKFQAQIITNGYLLTKDAVASLKSLCVTRVQVTIDGSEKTHDKRRPLLTGGGTYAKIIENITHLMSSDWEGHLDIRVNIDGKNSEEFAETYNIIKAKYPHSFGKRINVYPGFVDSHEGVDTTGLFNSCDKGAFVVEMSKKFGINALPVFPKLTVSGCTMTKRQAYVVGPEGELYKCWRDLGKPGEVIGGIDCEASWDLSRIAEGMVGASYLNDADCEKCLLFPVCDGGCPKLRMLNNRDRGNRATCSYFKSRIREFLELHYRQNNYSLQTL